MVRLNNSGQSAYRVEDKKSGTAKSTTITLRPTAVKSKFELNHQIDNNQNPEKGFVPRWETRVSWGVSFAISFSFFWC